MKKIEKRALLCLLLAGALLAGTVLFVGRFLVNGSSWASFPAVLWIGSLPLAAPFSRERCRLTR